MANTLYPQLQNFTLYSSGAAIGDISVVLSSMKSIDGVQLTMANFGDKGFITIDPSGGSLEEQISFSGLTVNANGTSTLTGVKSVLCLSPYTETSGLAKQHSGGATAVVAITSGLLAQFANKGNAETITGVYTFTSTAKAKYNIHPTFSADEEIVDKKYVDDTAIAGSPNASETVKGLVQLATGAELAAGTTTGTTGARLTPATSSCKNTSAGAGDANKIPVLGADGLLDQTFLDKARTWATIQTFSADTCQITSDADSANDAVRKSYMDTQIVASVSQSLGVGTSGEALAIGDAVYLKAADGRLYKSDTDADESTFSFVGVNQTTAGGAGITVNFTKPGGIATGLTGLTAGAVYFLTGAAGVIGTTPGTRFAKIGQAMSTTTLLVKEPKFIVKGSTSITATGNTVVTIGFYPAQIEIRASAAAYSTIGDDGNRCTKCYGTGFSTAVWAWQGEADVSNRCSGTVSAKSATGFTFNCSTYNGAQYATTLDWVAYSA
jgi:hypothetical protein